MTFSRLLFAALAAALLAIACDTRPIAAGVGLGGVDGGTAGAGGSAGAPGDAGHDG